MPLPIPTTGTGGTGTTDDLTTSSIRLNVNGIANQLITGVTVNLTLTAPQRQRPGHHPDGPRRPDRDGPERHFGPDGSVTLNNAPFDASTGLDGGPVNGTYTLTIDDTKSNNTGTLTGWSVTVDSELPTLGLQSGAPMDQNADGTSDENPLTLADGYTA